MKYILIALLTTSFCTSYSQQLKLTINAANQALTIIPEENNDNLFTLDAAALTANNFLTIHVNSDVISSDWKRSFSIYDSADSAIKDFVFMKDGSYCIKLSEIKTLLQPGKEYFIYTVALPKDPKKAMLVKVARTQVCKIKIL